MASAVYVLCTVTALACAVVLLRGYARARSRLLLASGLCFAGLALNHALVFVDVVVVPEMNLIVWRHAVGLASAAVLLAGLVWETR